MGQDGMGAGGGGVENGDIALRWFFEGGGKYDMVCMLQQEVLVHKEIE